MGIDASFSLFTPSCVHRFLISSPNLRIDAASSLLQLRTARLQHHRSCTEEQPACRMTVADAGGGRIPRRRHNPKEKAAGVVPAPAATTVCIRLYSSLPQRHEKTATEALPLRFRRGVTGNRTRDTRIFSPLLYQLSYDTIVSFGIAKIRTFSVYPNFSSVFSAESIFLICI